MVGRGAVDRQDGGWWGGWTEERVAHEGEIPQMISSGLLWVVGKMGNSHFLQKCVGVFLGHRKEMRPDTK